MTISGVGSPIGYSGAGIGMPITSPALAAAGYGKSTTGAVSSVNIDNETHDYTFDVYGSEEGMSDTGQRVFLCLSTLRGSRLSFQAFGFKRPTKVSANIQNEVYELVRVAMAPVLDDGSAELLNVAVTTDVTRVYALVEWMDVARSQKRTTKATF